VDRHTLKKIQTKNRGEAEHNAEGKKKGKKCAVQKKKVPLAIKNSPANLKA